MPQHPEPSLLLRIKPSQQLKALVLLIHALALGASLANDLSLVFKSILIIGTCLQGWITLKHSKNNQLTIKYTDTIGWQISKDHDLAAIEILNSTVVTPFAIFLHYKKSCLLSIKTTQEKHSHLILNDTLSDEDFRRLIVKLKITHIK